MPFQKNKIALGLGVLVFVLVAETAISKPISGAFIQISSYMAGYSQSDWDEEIRLMHEAGMDTIIAAPSISEGQAHYPSSLPFVTSVTDNGLIMILNACDTYNMKCIVGLVGDSRYWASFGHEALLTQLAAHNNAAADELLPIVNQHTSFAGWYLNEEIVFTVWTGGYQEQLINSLLKPVVNHLKAITPGKPVATAPYIADINAGATRCYEWWNYTLGQVDFDIVMLQDGFGADPGRQPEQVVPYFRELGRACSNNGAEFWNDLEVFNQADWSARKFSDAKVQITLNEKYVGKIVVFEWFYITPTQRMRGQDRMADSRPPPGRSRPQPPARRSRSAGIPPRSAAVLSGAPCGGRYRSAAARPPGPAVPARPGAFRNQGQRWRAPARRRTDPPQP
jgi:hypothetical protein